MNKNVQAYNDKLDYPSLFERVAVLQTNYPKAFYEY